MKQDEIMPVVTVILAIASAVIPIVFGFVLWKMQTIFVTKAEFSNYKETAESERREMKATLKTIVECSHSIELSVARLEERKWRGADEQ